MTEDSSNLNWGIIGHENIVNFLRAGKEHNRLSHAYLFFGPKGVGRKILAKSFIQYLLCEKVDISASAKATARQACGKCRSCEQVEKNIHPDVFFVEKQPDKKNISIEQIRELSERLSLGSFLNGYKAAIIDEAETMTTEAGNALLKTLEEPKGKTILIIISNSLNSFPDTVRSRCQILKFLPVPEQKIFNYLEDRGLGRNEAENLAHLSFGRPGLAISFLENKEEFAEYEAMVREFLNLMAEDINGRFSFINDIASLKYDTGEMVPALAKKLEVWRIVLRDLLFIKYEAEEFISNRSLSGQLQKIGKNYSAANLISLLKKIKQTKEYLFQNVNPKLTLENFALNL